MNTAVKVTYILCATLIDLSLLSLAVFSPLYLTPGMYYWTFGGLVLMVIASVRFSKRLNTWSE